MIVGISIRNFRGIRLLENLELKPFQVLVGPNASGKSTFLDTIDFVRDCLAHGPRQAVELRNIPDFDDLTFNRQGGKVEIELWLDMGDILPIQQGNLLRYTVSIRKDDRLGTCMDGELLGES